MSFKTYSQFQPNVTPQSQPIPDEPQVKNTAGGYVFEIDKWAMLDRFLILGTEGGTYYTDEQKLTRENAQNVLKCLTEDSPRVMTRAAEISDKGRAIKNDPAIFVLGLGACSTDPATREAARTALPYVCRTPTHLFHFLEYVEQNGAWGRGLRTAVSRWYGRWNSDQLAYELVKYQARDGWANKDAFRKAHVEVGSPRAEAALRWAVGAPLEARMVVRKNAPGRTFTYPSVNELPPIIAAFEEAKTASTTRLVQLIREHNLPREAVPTEQLKHVAVWEALLERMPMTALIRNLGKMTSIELLKPLSNATAHVVKQLSTPDYLRKGRVHPMAVLLAMKTYEQGHGDKGHLRWKPVRQVIDGLDAAFYGTFENVVPTNKRIMLALDVSGSMTTHMAASTLSCRDASAALALVTARTEPNCMIVGFTGATRHGAYRFEDGTEIRELGISPRQRLDDVIKVISGLPFGRTDCSLPMTYARERDIDVDAFSIYTDNETWFGDIHPVQALDQYRKPENRRKARLAVLSMTPTHFSIARQNDPSMLDLVGFDTSTSQALSEFIRG